MHTCTSRHFSSAPVRRGQASRRPRRVAQRMAVDTVDKLISSSAIPAQLPRDDFVDHIMKWASIEFCHSGDYTVPMRVEPVEGAPGQLQGFTVWLAQLDGAGKEEEVTAMRFHFDEDESNFCMTKVATGIEVTHGEDVLVQHLKFVAQKTAAAIDSYYTFGTALDGGEDF